MQVKILKLNIYGLFIRLHLIIKAIEVNNQELVGKTTIDFDFCGIKNHESIQNLLHKEQNYLNEGKNNFFSDHATKFSNSGQEQQRIICLTQNQFYVFPETICMQNAKSFFIKQVNEIILVSDDKEKCSLIIQNEFKLNLKTAHRNELVQFILKQLQFDLQPKVHYKQTKSFLYPGISNNESSSPLKQQRKFTEEKNQHFKIIIEDYGVNNQTNNMQKSHGLLSINNYQIILKIYDDNQNIKEDIQVKFLKKNIQARNLTFQSISSHTSIFTIMLQNEYDFPILAIKLEYLNKQLLQIK